MLACPGLTRRSASAPPRWGGEAIDKAWTIVTPIKQGRRFRIIGGVFTGVAPYQDKLTVAIPIRCAG